MPMILISVSMVLHCCSTTGLNYLSYLEKFQTAGIKAGFFNN
jgi:hypothetical protein